MTPSQAFNEEQRTRWNGLDGEYWASHQDRLDRTLAPVLPPLLEFAAPAPGSAVIDVGCGCGATTVEIARAIAPAGRVTGIDISAPMLALAAERLRPFPHAACQLGDAADLPLSGLNADLIVSRFGVMFFGDPAAAFTNLRAALITGGRLRFACWRPVAENPWLRVPLHAVYEHVPRLPKPDPEEPGPFSFGNTERVTRILTSAGFTAPSFTPLDLEIDIAAGGTLDDAVTQASAMGPAKRALADHPDDIRAAALESIRKALEPYASPSGVKLAAAIWLVAADNPK
ncbi:MAG TPA: class I SAM-dependent methyltransferase [Bryobacteraceae bacterium]|jgi:SAM-dependent methyltransferase|nr:class I SAM-dependent methyltransferase [Bryobacteraceae bacterium]